jgi:hypothetical protein
MGRTPTPCPTTKPSGPVCMVLSCCPGAFEEVAEDTCYVGYGPKSGTNAESPTALLTLASRVAG